MSLSTARSFLSEACYGEQELDANSALMELDKGLLFSCVANQALSFFFLHSFVSYPMCVYWGNENTGICHWLHIFSCRAAVW